MRQLCVVNWLRKQEMANGIVVSITKREIEYYD